jgi:Ni,Fe-hydrogenase III component G
VNGLDAGARVAQAMQEQLGAALHGVAREPADAVRLVIDRAAVRPATLALRDEFDARFLISVGSDRRELGGGFCVEHIFSLDHDHLYVVLDCAVAEDDARIDSISPLVPGASWAEREFRAG